MVSPTAKQLSLEPESKRKGYEGDYKINVEAGKPRFHSRKNILINAKVQATLTKELTAKQTQAPTTLAGRTFGCALDSNIGAKITAHLAAAALQLKSIDPKELDEYRKTLGAVAGLNQENAPQMPLPEFLSSLAAPIVRLLGKIDFELMKELTNAKQSSSKKPESEKQNEKNTTDQNSAKKVPATNDQDSSKSFAQGAGTLSLAKTEQFELEATDSEVSTDDEDSDDDLLSDNDSEDHEGQSTTGVLATLKSGAQGVLTALKGSTLGAASNVKDRYNQLQNKVHEKVKLAVAGSTTTSDFLIKALERALLRAGVNLVRLIQQEQKKKTVSVEDLVVYLLNLARVLGPKAEALKDVEIRYQNDPIRLKQEISDLYKPLMNRLISIAFKDQEKDLDLFCNSAIWPFINDPHYLYLLVRLFSDDQHILEIEKKQLAEVSHGEELIVFAEQMSHKIGGGVRWLLSQPDNPTSKLLADVFAELSNLQDTHQVQILNKLRRFLPFALSQLANSQNQSVKDLWDYLEKNTLGPIILRALINLASDEQGKVADDPVTEIKEKVYKIIKKFYDKHGLNGSSRDYYDAATELLQLSGLHEEPILESLCVLLLVQEQCHEWLFLAMNLAIKDQPGLLNWVEPSKTLTTLQKRFEEHPDGVLYLALAHEMTVQIVAQLPSKLQAPLPSSSDQTLGAYIAENVYSTACMFFPFEGFPGVKTWFIETFMTGVKNHSQVVAQEIVQLLRFPKESRQKLEQIIDELHTTSSHDLTDRFVAVLSPHLLQSKELGEKVVRLLDRPGVADEVMVEDLIRLVEITPHQIQQLEARLSGILRDQFLIGIKDLDRDLIVPIFNELSHITLTHVQGKLIAHLLADRSKTLDPRQEQAWDFFKAHLEETVLTLVFNLFIDSQNPDMSSYLNENLGEETFLTILNHNPEPQSVFTIIDDHLDQFGKIIDEGYERHASMAPIDPVRIEWTQNYFRDLANALYAFAKMDQHKKLSIYGFDELIKNQLASLLFDLYGAKFKHDQARGQTFDQLASLFYSHQHFAGNLRGNAEINTLLESFSDPSKLNADQRVALWKASQVDTLAQQVLDTTETVVIPIIIRGAKAFLKLPTLSNAICYHLGIPVTAEIGGSLQKAIERVLINNHRNSQLIWKSASSLLMDLIPRIFITVANKLTDHKDQAHPLKQLPANLMLTVLKIVSEHVSLTALDKQLSTIKGKETRYNLVYNAFLPAMEQILTLAGKDPTHPEHPLASLPLPEQMRATIWSSIPNILADLAANAYLAVEKAAQPIDTEKYLEETSNVIASFSTAFMRHMLANKEKLFVDLLRLGVDQLPISPGSSGDSVREYLRSNAPEYLASNAQFLMAQNCHAVNSLFNWTRDKLIKPLCTRMLDGFNNNLKLLEARTSLNVSIAQNETHDPTVCMIFVTRALELSKEFVTKVNVIAAKYNKSQPYRVPHDVMVREFGTYLHSSLRTQGMSPEEAAAHEMKEFFNPLSELILKFSQLSPSSVPGGEPAFKLLKEQFPYLVKVVYDQIGTPGSFETIKLQLISIIKEMFKNLNVPQSAGPQEEIPEDQIQAQQGLINTSGALLKAILGWLPPTFAAALLEQSPGLQQKTAEQLGEATRRLLSQDDWTMEAMFKMMMQVSTTCMHPGKWQSDDSFKSEPSPLQFIWPSTDGEKRREELRQATQVNQLKDAVHTGSQAVGLDGLKLTVKKAVDGLWYKVETSVDSFIAAKFNEKVVGPLQWFTKATIKAVAMAVALAVFLPFLLFNLTQWLLIKWKVHELDHNISMKINEDLFRKMLMLFFTTLVEELERKSQPISAEQLEAAARELAIQREEPDYVSIPDQMATTGRSSSPIPIAAA